MTARNTRCRFKRHLALLLCILMMFPAVFSLLTVSSYALTSDVSACEITEIGEVYYSAGGAKPIPEIKYEGNALTLNKDFTVSYRDNKQLGKATVIINGKGHFYGTVEKTFTVKARPLSETIITVSDVFYTEQGEKPRVSVSAEGKYFKEGVDYTVSYSDTETPHIVSVTVTGSDLLTGSKELTYNIMGVPIVQAEIICEGALTYTGDELCGISSVLYNGAELVENEDYTVSYQNNIDVGTAVATVTGVGNYSGVITKEYQIIPADISLAEFNVSGKYEPSGVALTVEGSYLEKTVSGDNFTYTAPEGAGLNRVVISGQGNFCGEKTVEVYILPADISLAAIKTDFINDGEDYLFSVWHGETELIKDTDYTIAVTENGNYADITVTGIGNYDGTLTDSVQVQGLSVLEVVQMPLIPDQIYTGEYIRPAVSITYKGEELTYGTDYY
ncbi:MAG: hypothetical protein IKT78_01385, partial [Ruminiclostridium sp.]|nr:hypothetical protein [Ruminiclostridium sp.]